MLCYVSETGELHAGIWWGDLRERGHMGDLGVDGRMILKLNCRKLDGRGMDWIDLA